MCPSGILWLKAHGEDEFMIRFLGFSSTALLCLVVLLGAFGWFGSVEFRRKAAKSMFFVSK